MSKKSRKNWLKIIGIWVLVLAIEFKFELFSKIIESTVYKWSIILITIIMFIQLLRIFYYMFIPKVKKAQRNVKKAYSIYLFSTSTAGILLFNLIKAIIKHLQ